MKRIMIFILALAASVNHAAAQSFTVTRDKLAPRLIDTRLPIQSFDQSYPSTPARTMTRGSVSAPDNLKWIDRIHNLPASMRGFYDRYATMIHEAKSGTDNALVNIKDGDTLHISECRGQKTFTLQEGENVYSREVVIGYANKVMMDVVDSLTTELNMFSPYLFGSIKKDYDIFWFSNSSFTTLSMAYNVERNGMSNKFTLYYTVWTVQELCDSEFNYDIRLTEFSDYNSLKVALTEYNSLIQTIIDDAPKTNRYEKVCYLNNWLTRNNAYSTNPDSESTSLICFCSLSALRGSNGPEGPVCEGYSRAMKVLCDALNIPCLLATGYAKIDISDTPGPHMWNEIQMDNGKWYAVDVTWNDPADINNPLAKNSGVENEDCLLIGKNDVVVSGLTFAQSHESQPLYENDYLQYWDYSYESPIEESRYDHFSSVQAPLQAETVNAYSIIGVNLGSFRSIDEAVSSLEPGIYIIGGRKVTVY